MKNRSVLTYLATLGTLTALPLFANRAAAAPVPVSSGMIAQISLQFGHQQPPPEQQMYFGEDQRRELRHIYWEIENANHGYNGHRREAVEQIRRAGEILGMDLHGHGYGQNNGYSEQSYGQQEPQELSDRQLSQARNRLFDMANNTQGPVSEHLRHAAHELDEALQSRD